MTLGVGRRSDLTSVKIRSFLTWYSENVMFVKNPDPEDQALVFP